MDELFGELLRAAAGYLMGGSFALLVGWIFVRYGCRQIWALMLRVAEAIEEIPRRLGGIETGQKSLTRLVTEVHQKVVRE